MCLHAASSFILSSPIPFPSPFYAAPPFQFDATGSPPRPLHPPYSGSHWDLIGSSVQLTMSTYVTWYTTLPGFSQPSGPRAGSDSIQASPADSRKSATKALLKAPKSSGEAWLK